MGKVARGLVVAVSACLAALPAAAQDRVLTDATALLDLAGPWQVRAGDDPSWATPACDDSTWMTLQVPGRWPGPSLRNATGMVWYRTSLQVRDSRLDARSVAFGLSVGEAISAYEVFVNGTHVGTRGSLPPKPTAAIAAAQFFAVPGRLLDERGHAVVAVRTWRDPQHVAIHGAFGSLWRGTLRFGPEAAVRAHVEAAQSAHLLREMHLAVLGLGFLFAAMYYARLARHRRNFAAAWWFGLTCGLQGVSTIANKYAAARMFGEAFEPLMRTTMGCGALALAAAMQFIWQLVDHTPARWERALQLAAAVLGTLGAAVLDSSQFFWWGGPVLVLGLVLAALAVVRAWRGGHPDAGLVGSGFVVMVLSAVFDIGAGQTLWPKLPVVRDALPFGFAWLLASMALSLSNQLGRAYADLDARNLELGRVNAATRRFVPLEFLRMLGKSNVADVDLGNQVQRQMTVLFSDLRSFTDLSERMTPAETFAFVNQYFRHMVPVIRANRGFVDKYVGDAIMALFEYDADDGLRAAIGIQHALRLFNGERAAAGMPPVQCGVGLHSGSVMVGTVGSATRMDATVMSDAVNLAARIESATKQFGVAILVTEATLHALQSPDRFDTRRVGRVLVKGKSAPVALFEVFNADPEDKRQGKLATRARFEAAVARFEAGEFAVAAEAFTDCAERAGDEVARLLADHSRAVLRHSLRQSAWSWDGVVRLEAYGALPDDAARRR